MAKAIAMLWQPGVVCLLQGITALHWAAVRGHAAVVETLMLNSADLEAENKNGVVAAASASLALT